MSRLDYCNVVLHGAPACSISCSRHRQSAVASAQVAAVCRSGFYQLRPLVRSMSAEAVKTLFQAFTYCQKFATHLDYCNSLFCGISAVCPECGCTFGVGRSTLRPHHASATGAALASGSTSGGFQDGHPGLPVTVRHGSSLSCRRLPVGLRRRSSSPVFCHIKDVCCETNLQQLWRQVFCSYRSKAVEQPSS